MDALKRAEKAHQAEASSDGVGLGLDSTQGFSLDSIDEPGSGEQSLPGEPSLDQLVSPSEPGSDSGSGLSLENTQVMDGRLGLETFEKSLVDDDEFGAATLDSIGERSLDDTISLIDDDDAVDVPHRIPQESSDSPTRDDRTEAMDDESTAPLQGIAGGTDDQRRARAVFHAKEASGGWRGRRWVVVGVVPLLLLAIVGGVVFIYWDGLNETVFGKPAFVQAPQTMPRPVEPAPQPATEPVPSVGTQAPAEPAISAASDGGMTGATPAGGSEGAATTPVATESSRDPQPNMIELAASAPTVARVTRATDEDSGRRLSADEQVARAIQRTGLALASPTGGAAFKIKRKTTPDTLHRRLSRAYGAWMSGDLAAARRDYERVLRSDPRNRNALLGLGAVDVRQEKWGQASERYATLLRLNPRDSIAQAGLMSVQENIDPLRGESQIKILLREEPNAPHLRFTLGNMYAEQNRWGEAQSAYFAAYRLQNGNPDYAYNLAVSLDQLGKGAAAAGYYRLALELAGQNGAAFDQSSVHYRLLRLTFEDTAK
jgi:Flp pilus assembly protein TadD/nitrate reductase NapE component